ncbi:hypothetical protein LPJ71_002392, partial [Coemansia sp. S17]
MYSSTIATLFIGALAACASAMPNPIPGPGPIAIPDAAAIAIPEAMPIAVPDPVSLQARQLVTNMPPRNMSQQQWLA